MAAVALCCLLSAAGLQRPAVTLAATVAKCGAASTADRLLRVTVSDVATSSGLDLVTVRSRLAELSSEVPGSSMEVTPRGELVYAFPRNVAKKAARLCDGEHRRFISKARAATQTFVGLMLLASVATLRPLIDRRVWKDTERISIRRELTTLSDALKAPSSNPPDSGSSSSIPLALACYGLLFGDDGGRQAVEIARLELQFAAIAAAIRANKGAVCADQVRPFLVDRPPAMTPSEAEEGSYLRPVDDWILPILARFDGSPTVSDDGEIVYVFPELLPTTTRDAAYGYYPTNAPLVRGAKGVLKSLTGPQRSDFFEEPYRKFLVRGDARQAFAVAMANWLAVILLGALLGPWQVVMRSMRARGGSYAASALVGVNIAYGGLLVNGFLWVLLPAARRIHIWGYNLGVRRRNRRRRGEAARLVNPLQPVALRRRLEAARLLGKRGRLQVKAGSEAIYTSAKSLLEQADTYSPERDAWDEELRKRTEQ